MGKLEQPAADVTWEGPVAGGNPNLNSDPVNHAWSWGILPNRERSPEEERASAKLFVPLLPEIVCGNLRTISSRSWSIQESCYAGAKTRCGLTESD